MTAARMNYVEVVVVFVLEYLVIDDCFLYHYA